MAENVSPAATTYIWAAGHDVGLGVAVAPDVAVAVAVGCTVGTGVGPAVVGGVAVWAAGVRVGPAALVEVAVGLSTGSDPTPLIPAAGADGLAVDAGRVGVALAHPAMRLAVVRSTTQSRCPVGLPFKMGCPFLPSVWIRNLVARRD